VTKKLLTILLLGGVVTLGWLIARRLGEESKAKPRTDAPIAAPVEVANVEQRSIMLRRTLSGTLESTAEFVVAPKVGGRLVRLDADLGDSIRRGHVIAWLDDEEYVLDVAQAEADLAVVKATKEEAERSLEIVTGSLQRIESLREKGVASETEYDVARAEELAKRTRLEVAKAQIVRAEAALEAARVRLAYTKVTANWSGGADQRLVAARYVDVGDTVGFNAALFSIVELDPVTGIVFVAERDYALLAVGQAATLTTDAYPGERFTCEIKRIAPVFRQASRQARVELTVANPDRRLKPGMFIRATIELAEVKDATVVPFAAITERGGSEGVFVVGERGETVRFAPVRVGIRDDAFVQVDGEGIWGRVVVLGQQLCSDGGAITIPEWAAGGAGTHAVP
jgi:RND family efflux transporter MFP subunit